MPVIVISSDEFQKGREIAISLAKSLDYRLVDQNLLGPAAEAYEMDEAELRQALEKTPPLFLMRSRYKFRLACIESACLEQLLEDQVVCFGLAAEMYVSGVSHVMKVRVKTDREQLARKLAQDNSLSLERARKMIREQQDKKLQWSLRNYKMDQEDPSLYDYVLSQERVEPEKVIQQICDLANDRRFQPMTYSRMCMHDIALASKIRLRLMKRFPEIKVEAEDGTVAVYVQTLKKDRRKKQDMMRQLAGDIPGLRRLELHEAKGYHGQRAQKSL
jgi:cytidylate kinase